jgi:hypothetical protein
MPTIYAAGLLLGMAIGRVARALGLPTWTANEAYITRLRRWRQQRRFNIGR